MSNSWITHPPLVGVFGARFFGNLCSWPVARSFKTTLQKSRMSGSAAANQSRLRFTRIHENVSQYQ
jgi:hypothetical protein